MDEELDPFRGVWRWAWRRAAHYRRAFSVSAVALTAVLTVANATLRLPAEPTFGDRVANGAIGLASATGFVVVATTVYALVVAPYEQRRELRQRLRAATSDAPPPPVAELLTLIDSLTVEGRRWSDAMTTLWQQRGADGPAEGSEQAARDACQWAITAHDKLHAVDPRVAERFVDPRHVELPSWRRADEWRYFVTERLDRLHKLKGFYDQ